MSTPEEPIPDDILDDKLNESPAQLPELVVMQEPL